MALQELGPQTGQTLAHIETAIKENPDFALIGRSPVMVREPSAPAWYRYYAATHYRTHYGEMNGMLERFVNSLDEEANPHFPYEDPNGTVFFGYVNFAQPTQEIIGVNFYPDRKLGELARRIAESELPGIHLIQGIQWQITREQNDFYRDSMDQGMRMEDIMSRLIARATVAFQRL